MAGSRRQPPGRRLRSGLVRRARAALDRVTTRPRGRAAVRRVAAELERSLVRTVDGAGTYDDRYFGGGGRNPLARLGLSGYERYDRATSNADCAAYLVWRHLPGGRVLDVGCAMGFVVEALRELGYEAEGADVSWYAVEHAAPGAVGHVHRADLLEGLPWPDRWADVVTCLETLEHLPPDRVDDAIAELRRVCGGFLVATIPSFGPNAHGPGGWLEAKVADERLDYYRSLGPGFEGPVPWHDLFRDATGAPIEGHLTIASFSWWTRRFEAAGFVRCGDLERRMHPEITRMGLSKYWNLYVLRVPEVAEPTGPVRSDTEAAALARRWGLDRRRPEPGDLERLEEALGPGAAARARSLWEDAAGPTGPAGAGVPGRGADGA